MTAAQLVPIIITVRMFQTLHRGPMKEVKFTTLSGGAYLDSSFLTLVAPQS